VQVPEQVLQVPLPDEVVTLRMVEERRSEFTLQWMPVFESIRVEGHNFGSDLVRIRTTEATHVGGLTEKIHFCPLAI
jgi:hypothetical protein